MMAALLEIVLGKKWQLIAVAIGLLLNIGLLVWIDGHQTQAISSAQVTWNDLRRRLASTGRESVENRFRQGKTDLDAIRERIPEKRQFASLLGDLIENAASSGVTVGPITYKPESIRDEHLLAYVVTISVSGRYAAIKSFLSDQLKKRELLIVDAISLTNSDPYEENVTMNLHMTVYLREEA